jgi:hypothetical protein
VAKAFKKPPVRIKKRPEKQEIATTRKDFDLFAGFISNTRLYNPDPVLNSESNGKGLRMYDEVGRDPHAGSVLQTRALSIVGKDWSIIPGQSGIQDNQPISTSEDENIAAQVEQTLRATNFDEARMELLKGVLYGYYCSEIMWSFDEDEGAIVIDKFIGKHARRFCFTPDRELRLLTINNMYEGEQLPGKKFICFTFGDTDNPYGQGLGQSIWWPVWFKKNGIKFWLTFLDKFGMPTGVGKYPAGTGDDDQSKLLAAINLIHSETVSSSRILWRLSCWRPHAQGMYLMKKCANTWTRPYQRESWARRRARKERPASWAMRSSRKKFDRNSWRLMPACLIPA